MTFPQLALLHLIATVFMTGVIWFVQVVHYPLFKSVGERAFRRYEERHTTLTTFVVLPPMFAELGLSFWLLLRAPADLQALTIAGAVMVATIWASTFAVQVPCHARLAAGYDIAAWRRLVRSNWLRTGLWSARALIATAILWC